MVGSWDCSHHWARELSPPFGASFSLASMCTVYCLVSQNCGFLRTPDIPVDHWQHWRTLAVRFQSAYWDNENTMTTRWFFRHMASYRTPPVQMRQVVIAVPFQLSSKHVAGGERIQTSFPQKVRSNIVSNHWYNNTIVTYVDRMW